MLCLNYLNKFLGKKIQIPKINKVFFSYPFIINERISTRKKKEKARALNIIEICPTFRFPRDKIERFHFSFYFPLKKTKVLCYF